MRSLSSLPNIKQSQESISGQPVHFTPAWKVETSILSSRSAVGWKMYPLLPEDTYLLISGTLDSVALSGTNKNKTKNPKDL
jgi:hypothetical protein